MTKITIYDPTMRDGSHAVAHTLTKEDIVKYCTCIDNCGVDVVEVGHGNGLGASSLQLGVALQLDQDMLINARENLKSTRLGVHMIPGFAKFSDINVASDAGVDVIRIASHCTEADLTQGYIEYARNKGMFIQGVLMMAHMADPERLLIEARKLTSYGAQAVVLMDSAGNLVGQEVADRIKCLVEHLNVPVGFHGHNNLGMAVANTLIAVQAGATIVDGTLCGFGAGAGNTQLEVLVAVLMRHKYEMNVDIFKLCDAIASMQDLVITKQPVINTTNLMSGFYGVCAGFEKHVAKAAKQFGTSVNEIWEELASVGAVAGQEDLIIEVAARLAAWNK